MPLSLALPSIPVLVLRIPRSSSVGFILRHVRISSAPVALLSLSFQSQSLPPCLKWRDETVSMAALNSFLSAYDLAQDNFYDSSEHSIMMIGILSFISNPLVVYCGVPPSLRPLFTTTDLSESISRPKKKKKEKE